MGSTDGEKVFQSFKKESPKYTNHDGNGIHYLEPKISKLFLFLWLIVIFLSEAIRPSEQQLWLKIFGKGIFEMYNYVTTLSFYRAKTDSMVTTDIHLTTPFKLKKDDLDDLYVDYLTHYSHLIPGFKLFTVGFTQMVKK